MIRSRRRLIDGMDSVTTDTFAKNTRLVKLSISGFRLKPDNMRKLMSGLAKNTSITQLLLSRMFGREAPEQLLYHTLGCMK